MLRPRSSASRVSVFDACALSRRSSSIRARMVAKSSAARGRVTSPPQNLTEPFSGSHGVSGWVCPVKGSPTSRTQGCRRKQKSSDRSEEAEGAFDQTGGRRRPISIAVEIVDRNCRILNLIVRLITIPAGEPRQNNAMAGSFRLKAPNIRSMSVLHRSSGFPWGGAVAAEDSVCVLAT